MTPHEAIVRLAETIADTGTAEYTAEQLYELTNELEDFLDYLIRNSLLTRADLIAVIESWGETRGLVA